VPKVKLIRDVMPNLLPMVRTPGTHVSALIHEICLTLGHYKDDGGEPNMARMELGNCFEHALIQRLELDDPDRYVRIGEIECEGLYGTPDLIDVIDECDDEVKCTFMSSKNGPGSEKFYKYETQLKAYLYMLGWNKGRLHVLFVKGDYTWTPAGEPQYRQWEYIFSQAELDANWSTLKQQAARKAR
jgi:hypothetical protein